MSALTELQLRNNGTTVAPGNSGGAAWQVPTLDALAQIPAANLPLINGRYLATSAAQVATGAPQVVNGGITTQNATVRITRMSLAEITAGEMILGVGGIGTASVAPGGVCTVTVLPAGVEFVLDFYGT